MPEQLYGLTIEDIRWLRRLRADLDSGRARILRRREATSAPNIQTVKPSSATLDTSDANEDRYPGHWYERDPSTGTLTQKDAVWIVTPNGEEVDTATYYEGAVQHGLENGRPVFCAIVPGTGGSGTTITVKEADGSPTYTSIDTLNFDQADGFVVTNPSAGVAQVDQTAASASTVGYVTTGSQTIAGLKDFSNGTIRFNNGSGGIPAVGHAASQAQIQITNSLESTLIGVHLVGAHSSTVPGTVLQARDSSNAYVSPSYGIETAASTYAWGVWGTDAIGNVISGGIITTQGALYSAPANSSATGTAGNLAYDSSFLYVCTASNTWKRITLSSF